MSLSSRTCVICLDGAGMDHNGAYKVLSVMGRDGEFHEQLEPCRCECHHEKPPAGSPRTYRCHYCGLSDPDPEVVFDHMNRRECQPPAPVSPWVQKAREGTLPGKRLA